MNRKEKLIELRKIINSNDGDKVINDIFNYFDEKKCRNCKFSTKKNHNEASYLCEFLDECVELREDFSCDYFVIRKEDD